MGIRILIPCKALSVGKTRLSGVLAESERVALCSALLAQTVALANKVAPATVVTSDSAAADIARHHNAEIFFEPPGADLNTALSAAFQTFSPADAVLVLPIDLPLLTTATMMRVCADEDSAAIVPDRTARGTNLMLLPRNTDKSFRFQYGSESFSRHCAEAKRLQIASRICRFADAAFDIDTPADLAELRRRGTTNGNHIERAANDRTSLQSRQILRWPVSDEINGHS